jgi:hypothetical protein
MLGLWCKYGFSDNAVDSVFRIFDPPNTESGTTAAGSQRVRYSRAHSAAVLKKKGNTAFNRAVRVCLCRDPPVFPVACASRGVSQGKSTLFEMKEVTFALDKSPVNRKDQAVFRYCSLVAGGIRLYANDDVTGALPCVITSAFLDASHWQSALLLLEVFPCWWLLACRPK